MIKQCDVCQRCKPNFHKPPQENIIKAMKPFECLSIDFKGPIPSATKNIYMLTIIDEYLRFPFVYPCENTNTDTVIACLSQLFSLFGMPHYIHSDRGSSFMSGELKDYLSSKGIATSRTTPYNPQCNGQTECYNQQDHHEYHQIGVAIKTVTNQILGNHAPRCTSFDSFIDQYNYQ